MTLDVAYSYCTNLTEREKLEIDKQVRKNRLMLKFAIFFPIFSPFPLPMTPFFPVEGFSPQQIIRNARDRAESAVAEKMAPLADDCKEAYEAYNEYKESKDNYKMQSQNVRNLLKISGGDLGKASNPGTRARSDARNTMNNRGPKGAKSKPGGSVFTEAWLQKPSNRSRPGQAEGGNGLFGRFSARPTPDPSNPGCTGGPRSITVLEGQSKNQDGQASSEKQPNTRTFEAHDGFKAELTDKSASHLTSNHGHKFGVDDPLPLSPNQKPTKYKQIRTRLNKENKAKVGKEIESILSNPESEVYPDVSIRGIQGRVYYCPDTDRVVGIHTEGEFEGQIMKAQPISDSQLDLLNELNILD